MFSQHHLLLALSEKEKVTWLLLVASPISHEMILVYGASTLASICLRGLYRAAGKEEECSIGWLHQGVKLTVNNMIH